MENWEVRTCPDCKGTGLLNSMDRECSPDCPTCDGAKRVEIRPYVKERKE